MRRRRRAFDEGLRRIPALRRGRWRLYTVQEWPLIGAAPKGYLAFGDPSHPKTLGYIAKAAKNCGAQECVTEEIISQIGRMLPLRLARSRLVRLPGPGGRHDDVRFMSENFIERGRQQLIHGVEVMARYLEVSHQEMHSAFRLDDPGEERRFYSIDGVIHVLKMTGRNEDERRHLLVGLGRMIAFDALIGAPDRHALNWGLIADLEDLSRPLRFAPLFDTARGLFWNYEDTPLKVADRSGTLDQLVSRYAEKSCPVFSCAAKPLGQSVNHFQLVDYCLERYEQEIGAAIRHMVQTFSPSRVENMLRYRIGSMISAVRRKGIVVLLRYRHQRLQKIIEEHEGQKEKA